jgi:hypothetical protein
MCVEGMGPSHIAQELSRRGLKLPQAYKAERDGVEPRHILKRPDTMWHSSVVAGILSNREYTGTAVINRKTSKSYKDHRKFIKPEEEWFVHENAHPRLIDVETWETVKRIRSNRRQVQRKTYEKGALELEAFVSEATVQTAKTEAFLRLVRSFTDVTELTSEVVHEFISKILVGEAEYTPARYSHGARGKKQEIKIIYNYLGDISETIKEE